MKIGDRIFVRGYIDEIRKDTVIVRNDGGYFGTILSEIITGELPSAQQEEPSYEAVKEYCRKRCLSIVDSALLKKYASAQPERKSGQWIPQDHNKVNGMTSTAVYYYPKCSACGYCAYPTNFCPNCGADMRGRQNG